MDCLSLITILQKGHLYKVPCGKCAFCLSNKRSQWMFRIFHEMRYQENPGWFLTFTYEEKYVKRTAHGLSLRFRDIQLYIKKLRKAKYYAKYICVGEYGRKTKRPHYHMLLWTNCPCMQLENYWKATNGQMLGRIHTGRLTMASAMYTLKYIIQPKEKGLDGLEKTRAQFSKGLGLGYLTTAVYNYHTDDYDNPVFTSRINGAQVALPRYYKYKIFTKYQLAREGYKLKRRKVHQERKQRFTLLDKGIKGVKQYMKDLRTEQAARIIKTTKFNETL